MFTAVGYGRKVVGNETERAPGSPLGIVLLNGFRGISDSAGCQRLNVPEIRNL